MGVRTVAFLVVGSAVSAYFGTVGGVALVDGRVGELVGELGLERLVEVGFALAWWSE